MIEAPSAPFDAAILSVEVRTASCSRLAHHQLFTLQTKGLGNVVSGEIVTIRPEASQRRGGKDYVTGEIDSVRLDAKALGLMLLGLLHQGTWEPAEKYWGEEGEPIEEWARPIIAKGPRPMFEMEQVYLGDEPRDIDTAPILMAVELGEAGDTAGARWHLMDLLETDLRSCCRR